MNVALRLAAATDAERIAALAIQVFLDTYATEGVRPDLATEALGHYGTDAFRSRLIEARRRFVLGERGPGLVGFAEVILQASVAPGSTVFGAELVRLYVQPKAQARGIGRALLQRSEGLAEEAGLPAVWLTAWEHNSGALAFYAKQGYETIGATRYEFQGRRYTNHVLARRLPRRVGAA
ncbi:MAG: GNAT family N-acetyltransferase [Pseudomonadota bacterium]|jgi:ribosomal protein S18 acetylase RimI-like enzyme|nr:GNAT family N-acetyltransferase [Rubrivivax sp.]